MKTLVLGLGNPILSDDGVGLRVAGEVARRIGPQQATVVEASIGGLNLLDLLTGYDKAIVVDAMQTEDGKAGEVRRLAPEMFAAARHAISPHDVDLPTALELGKALGLALPGKIVLFGIEVADATTFSEECTREVKRAIPACTELILEELERNGSA